jgi:D-serine deaminase-like pyridoxal phosphate-dependent protein
MLGINKKDLDTPCLVLDKNKLISNIKAMQSFALKHNKKVRPHAKTHKCPEICHIQKDYGCIGISITKPSEALELAMSGVKDLLITSPIVTHQKLKVLSKILELDPNTMVVTDSEYNLIQLNKLGASLSLNIKVLIDVDSGIGRTGLAVNEAYNLGIMAHKSSNICLAGVQCYAGHIQHIQDFNQRLLDSERILISAIKMKKQLEEATGLHNLIQSGSGTGTFEIDCQINGVTEIQPGSYIVMDQEYYEIDHSLEFQSSMTLLTTVISANNSSHVTVDAGTKSIYKEETFPKIISHDNLNYEWSCFGDEHGKITGRSLPNIGDVIEMIVPHCDPTINLHDKFYLTENDIVVDIWDIKLRGKTQ